MKLGIIQVDYNFVDGLPERREKMLSYARSCFEDGADLVFFPEEYQYLTCPDLVQDRAALERAAAEWKEMCSCLAREYGAYIVPWDYEVLGGKVYNTSYVLDRSGEEIGRFRKVHLPYFEQKKGFSAGGDFPVFDLDFGKLGIMICFDNYFPESARILSSRGAGLILLPLYGDTLRPGWEIKLRARAADNAVYVASEQIDGRFDFSFSGLVGPDGEIIEKLTEAPSCRVVDIDLERRPITHTTGDPSISEDYALYMAKCRNPDAYGCLTEKSDPPSWDDVFLGKAP